MRHFWIACSLAACASPEAAVPEPLRAAAASLVAAPPGSWPEAARPVLEAGGDATPALIQAIDANPDGPGVQPALAVLGEFGRPAAVPLLERWLDDDRIGAYEAALSLGHMRAERSRSRLRATMSDPDRPAVMRTAAACALLDLGAVTDATPLLHAVLIAGTPAGVEPAAQHGLPDKPRWALERNLVIDAVKRHTGGEDFGLDADSPWPKLSEAAARCRAALLQDAEER